VVKRYYNITKISIYRARLVPIYSNLEKERTRQNTISTFCIFGNMFSKDFIAFYAFIISCFAAYLTYLAHRSTVILNIENQLTARAVVCNQYLEEKTYIASKRNGDVSVVVTNIIYAYKLIVHFYESHGFILRNYDRARFIDFFYMQLHTSIIELIKNPLEIIDPDGVTTPEIIKQHALCQWILKTAIDKNLSRL